MQKDLVWWAFSWYQNCGLQWPYSPDSLFDHSVLDYQEIEWQLAKKFFLLAIDCLCGGFVHEGGIHQGIDLHPECIPMPTLTDKTSRWVTFSFVWNLLTLCRIFLNLFQARTCLDEYGQINKSNDKICSMGFCDIAQIYCIKSIVRYTNYTYTMFS